MNRKQFLLSLPLIGLAGKLFGKKKQPIDQIHNHADLIRKYPLTEEECFKKEMHKVFMDEQIYGRGVYRIDEIGLTRIDPISKEGQELTRINLEWENGNRFGKVTAVKHRSGKFKLLKK